MLEPDVESVKGAQRNRDIITERLLLREFIVDDWHAVLVYRQDSLYL